jgi:hypothetical protein
MDGKWARVKDSPAAMHIYGIKIEMKHDIV